MIEREFAVRLVQEHLDREGARKLVVTHAEEHELVWIVYYQVPEYVRTGDSRYLLGGNGPYLVDRLDGGLHQIGPVDAVTGDWEADYRSRIRGRPTPGPVEELHEEIRKTAAACGRTSAMRLLRQRIPAFASVEAAKYVAALQADTPAPANLKALVDKTLVPAPDPVLCVKTIRDGNTGSPR
ncbi:YrhB domain-containing protein [Streptomyces sp. 8N114]|uniref:YrhB domain-containing protein n=1 Tax=Streptomyces sp. 8N114 TaxID=3457419 RepID=UPI003FD4A98D